jgi:hypothetical protein
MQLLVVVLTCVQALKANADAAPKDLKLNSNYITRFGQVSYWP